MKWKVLRGFFSPGADLRFLKHRPFSYWLIFAFGQPVPRPSFGPRLFHLPPLPSILSSHPPLSLSSLPPSLAFYLPLDRLSSSPTLLGKAPERKTIKNILKRVLTLSGTRSSFPPFFVLDTTLRHWFRFFFSFHSLCAPPPAAAPYQAKIF